jgi:predicted transposase/invertase (TIGR01784 family)
MLQSDFTYCKITNDVAFKSIFISPDDGYRSLITLLNNTLNLSLETIGSVAVLNPPNRPDFAGDKVTVLDVKAVNSSKENYNIEIQLSGHLGSDRRILYDWAKLFSHDRPEKKPFSHFKKTHSLIILEHTHFSKYPDEYFFEFEIREKNKHLPISDTLRISVIELSKVQDSMPHSNADAWALFLKNPNNSYKEEIMKTFPEMKDVYSKLGLFSSDRIKREAYEAREKFIQEESLTLEIEGKKEG